MEYSEAFQARSQSDLDRLIDLEPTSLEESLRWMDVLSTKLKQSVHLDSLILEVIRLSKIPLWISLREEDSWVLCLASKGFCDLLNLELDQVLGQTHETIFTEESLESLLLLENRALSNNTSSGLVRVTGVSDPLLITLTSAKLKLQESLTSVILGVYQSDDRDTSSAQSLGEDSQTISGLSPEGARSSSSKMSRPGESNRPAQGELQLS
jgi:hypothetical protein